jgi:hypothetical protein
MTKGKLRANVQITVDTIWPFQKTAQENAGPMTEKYIECGSRGLSRESCSSWRHRFVGNLRGGFNAQ